jgi:hypothetical protein
MTVLFAIPGSGRSWSRKQAVESILRVNNRVFHRWSRDDSFPGPGNRIAMSFLLIRVPLTVIAVQVEMSTFPPWKFHVFSFEGYSRLPRCEPLQSLFCVWNACGSLAIGACYHFCIFFLVWPLLPAHCRCRGLLLHTITLRHATLGRTPLDEGSVRRRDLYLTTHNTHKRQASVPIGGIRTRNPSKRAAADPRRRPHGHWDRHVSLSRWHILTSKRRCNVIAVMTSVRMLLDRS